MQGFVATATSFKDMEKKGKQAFARGVVFERGSHSAEAEARAWVALQPEMVEAFARELLLVSQPPAQGCGDPSHPCGATQHPTNLHLSGPKDIHAACVRLAERLPSSLRGAVRKDAQTLATMLKRMCPKAPFLTMQLEIVGNCACKRWHQDNYVGRATITYAGPGTWLVDDSSVQFDQFEATRGAPMEISDPRIVPSFDSIHKPRSNAVVLMKGNHWSDIPLARGVTHKSPNVRTDERGNVVFKRLILKVDLAMTEPGH